MATPIPVALTITSNNPTAGHNVGIPTPVPISITTPPTTGYSAGGLSARIVDISDLSDVLATCLLTSDRGGTVQHNDVGSFTITFQNDDPDLAVITDTSLITFSIDGIDVFTGMFEPWEALLVGPDAGAKVTTWTGRGHLALLDFHLVYPSLALGSKPIEEDRQCTWEANIYDWIAHGAVTATMVDTLANAQAGSLGSTPWDADQLDASTEVVGPTTATTIAAPIGTWYYNSVVTVLNEQDHQIQITVDDAADVVFDGAHIVNIPGGTTAGWEEMTTHNIFLSAGLHTLNAKVYNALGPTGFSFTIAELNGDGSLGTVIATSQAAFSLVIDYPTTEPGMTAGEAIELFFDEARNGTVLGALAGTDRANGDPLAAINLITLMFDGVNDSAGVPWPTAALPATKIGTSILTFLRELAAAGYIDFYMPPGTLDLYCWIGGTRGTTTAVDYTAAAGTLLEHRETGEL